MSYASVEEIKSELKNLTINADSALIKSDIESFLAQAASLIDTSISNRYVLPIESASTDALNVLKKIEIDIVVYRCDKILNLKKAQPIPKGIRQLNTTGDAYRESMKLLKKIVEGTITLSDVDTLSKGQGVESLNSINSIDPDFNSGVQQW